YLDYTHAYFPKERFDEVVTDGHWTFARRGGGYVALWSARPTQWRTYDDPAIHTHDLTDAFDLVATGGPDNPWIVQVADGTPFVSFAEFCAAVSASPVANGSLVTWTSPIEGTIEFSWTGPFRVDGEVVDLHPDARMDNPYVHVPFEGRQYDIRRGDAALHLDF